MRRPENTLDLVQRVLQRLCEAQVEVWLVGGWQKNCEGCAQQVCMGILICGIQVPILGMWISGWPM
ncbi:hypothetical protein KSX_55010 [Ktedonospora formicarum]|uniref:Uncharacterized protein n=1 Tax=Ktedonospora formicarum TaxID=2778364 RepID=A0A8J3MV60_9CHLR|nr:hypothetical protein KSX_55010 [Ktedonospora formicarum]